MSTLFDKFNHLFLCVFGTTYVSEWRTELSFRPPYRYCEGIKHRERISLYYSLPLLHGIRGRWRAAPADGVTDEDTFYNVTILIRPLRGHLPLSTMKGEGNKKAGDCPLSYLCRFFIDKSRFCTLLDAFARNDYFFHVLLRGDIVHDVRNQTFDNRTKSARARL